MRLHELYEQDQSDTLMPGNSNEFERAWAVLKKEADDPDDIRFYTNDVIKNDVHAIIRKNGYRMSLGSAESKYRKEQSQRQKPSPQTPAPTSHPASPKPTKPEKSTAKPGTAGKATNGREQIKPLGGKEQGSGLASKIPGKLGDLQKWATSKLKTGADAADKFSKVTFK